MRKLALFFLFLALAMPAVPAAAQSDASETPSIQEKTEGMQRIDGFIPL